MDINIVLAVLAGIIFLGFFSDLIFKKTSIPDILLLIIIGIIIGSVLEWSHPSDFGEGANLFATFALIFILFQGSLNLDFRHIIRNLPTATLLTVLSFLATASISAGISLFLGYPILESLLIGAILGGTSSAVVIPLVNNVSIREKYGSILTLESAFSDVLCIIGAVTILEIMITGTIVASDIFKSIISSFALAFVVGGILGLIWVFLMYKYESLAHSYLLTIAVVVGTYAFIESSYIGASGAIGALAFGLMLGNSRNIYTTFVAEKEVENNPVKNILFPSTKSFYQEISFFIKTFFFVYLGILIDFSNPMVFVYGALLTLGMFIIRPFVVRLLFYKATFEGNERAYLETLIPKGLAAAVLAGIAVQSGQLNGDLGIFVNIILSTVFLSIFVTSMFVFLIEKRKFMGVFPKFLTAKPVKK